MEYHRLEQFLVSALNKEYGLSQVEDVFIKVYNDALSIITKTQCKTHLNYTVNMQDVLRKTYNTLWKKKHHVVCLIFTDGNSIYEFKSKLETSIKFFKFAFDGVPVDNIITEFPLVGILDNYKYMSKIIKYINGWQSTENELNYVDILKLAEMDNYLMEVKYINSKLNHILEYELECNFKEMQINGIPQNYFDIVCDTCLALRMSTKYVMRYSYLHYIYNYKDELFASKLWVQLKIDDEGIHRNLMKFIDNSEKQIKCEDID